MNEQSADDSEDESHKMMSWTHQLMSQGNQVVETTPGHSQKLFKTPETVNLTEKNENSHQRHNRQHNHGKVTSQGSLLGLPVELQMELLFRQNTKQQSNLHTQGSNGHPNWLPRRSCMAN